MKTILAIALMIAMFSIPSVLASPGEHFPVDETPLVNENAFENSVPGSAFENSGAAPPFPGFAYDGLFLASIGQNAPPGYMGEFIQGLSWLAQGEEPPFP